jgi:hypothetical protein
MSENILDYTLPQHSDGSVEHELHDDEWSVVAHGSKTSFKNVV